ncbi:MAG: rRNA maturation RNase YbeY [Planctomycetaceae bacterium]|jgi:probable rRNA maturation factor|nr:rRNA maturation RNase YbeY [Planctomycetaceae bacterium]MBT6488059.1 rRNA maturation RNase YbeY [Planctomycetaceae bacterium]MBT6495743.1 rRNA maturation RNase YbeY [Planctomycetaceae bacterium]
MYNIDIANQQSLLEVDETLLHDVITKTLSAEQAIGAEVSVALVDDVTIHQVNKRHLQHDYPTDVISFLFDCEFEGETSESPDNDTRPPIPRGHGKRIDGEIVVSTETALERADECGFSPTQELVLYVVHGLLHLLGYDDTNDVETELMRSRERAILQLCDISPGVDS